MTSKLNDKELSALLKLLNKALGVELTVAADEEESDDDEEESDDEEGEDEEGEDEEGEDEEESDDEEGEDEEESDDEEAADPLEAARDALKALAAKKGKPAAVALLKKHKAVKISDLKGKKLEAFTAEAAKVAKGK